MAIHSTPGVYVQEDLSPIAPVGASTGASIGAFVGPVSRGPTGPVFCGSWSAFTSTFGGFSDTSLLLPYAVWSYFANGGRGCYISRAVRANAVSADVDLDDSQAEPETGLTVKAIAPGVWGNSISVGVRKLSSGRMDLIVRYGGATEAAVVERFADVSMDPTHPRYAVSIVNSPISGSGYIRITNPKNISGYVYNGAEDALVEVANAPLADGTEGTGSFDLAGALRQFDQIESNLVINFPGDPTASVVNDAITWAEERGTAFVVVDGAQQNAGSTADQVTSAYLAMVSGGGAISVSSYAAIYGPWLQMQDPSSSVAGAMRMLPPGGAVLGKFSQVEATRGIAKTPAGTETRLGGVIDLEARFSSTNTDALADAGVNAIRLVTGAGFCIMGGRTLRDGYPDRYVATRRTLNKLRLDLTQLTRFAIFEPNDSTLWNLLRSSITQYLNQLMQANVLRGNTESEAFFVKCDAENNPPNLVAVGRVNITVGVALTAPAEYIVITIAQYDGGTDVSVQA